MSKKHTLWALFSQEYLFMRPRGNPKDNIIFPSLIQFFMLLTLCLYFFSGYHSVYIFSNLWFGPCLFSPSSPGNSKWWIIGQFRPRYSRDHSVHPNKSPYRLYPLVLYINDFFDTFSLHIYAGHTSNFLKYLIRQNKITGIPFLKSQMITCEILVVSRDE